MKVAVIGAGIVGVTTAYELFTQGCLLYTSDAADD